MLSLGRQLEALRDSGRIVRTAQPRRRASKWVTVVAAAPIGPFSAAMEPGGSAGMSSGRRR